MSRWRTELVVISGRDVGKRIPVPAGGGVLGRGKDVDIHVSEEGVSRHHLRLDPRGNDWVLCDLGSTNGTYLGRERIQVVTLSDGDSFVVGKAMTLLLDCASDPEPTGGMPPPNNGNPGAGSAAEAFVDLPPTKPN